MISDSGTLRRLDRVFSWLPEGWRDFWQEEAALPGGPPSDTRRFGSGIVWNLAAAVVGQGSTMALGIALAHVLGAAGFGAYAIVQNTAVTLTNVAQLATGLMASKFVAELRAVNAARTGRVLGLVSVVASTTGVIAAGGLIVLAPLIASSALANADLAGSLVIAAATVFFGVVAGWQMGALTGFEAYRSSAVAALIGGTVALAGGIIGGRVGGLVGSLIGVAIGAGVRCFLLAWLLHRELAAHNVVIQYHGLDRERALLVDFAIPAALSGLLSTPALWVASAIVVRQPGGYDQLALFAAANAMRTLVMFLPQVVNGVSLPMLNHARGLDQPERFFRLFWRNLLVTGGLVGAGALAVIVTGPWLLSLYGATFLSAYSVLAVLMLSAVAEGLALGCYQVIQSEGRMWWSFLGITLPRDVLIVVLSLALVPRLGAVGLASAHAIAWSVGLTVTIAFAYRLGLKPRLLPVPNA